MIRATFVATGFFLCALLFLTGCNKKGSAPAKGGGAAKSNHDRLQGDWKFDFNRMKTLDATMKKMQPKELKMLEVMIAKMGLRFTRDKVIEIGGRKVTPKSYKVLADKNDTLLLESSESNGQVVKLTVVFHSDKSVTLTATLPGGKSDVMALRR